MGQVCLYDPSTKKRGLPEGYVRGLEKLWAVSIGKIQGLEDAVTSIITQQELLEIWNHETVGEDLHSMWKESSVLQELEGMLSRLESADSSSGVKKKREKDDVTADEVADSTFHRSPLYHVEDGSASSDSELQSPSKRRTVLHCSSTQKLDPMEVPLPPQTATLIDTYFSFTHCWFPIVERHCVLRTSYSHSRRARPGKTDAADMAALWAILAYTAQQSQRSGLEEKKTQRNSDMTGEEMRNIARNLIPEEDGPFAIGHVQALLVLVLLDMGLGKWSSAWSLAGQATRMALELGFGTNSTEKRGIHVLYGCFILDTLIASHLLRPPHLRRQDLEAVGYLEEDGYEEWDPWTSSKTTSSYRDPAFMISCFNRLLDIVMILNDTICEKRDGPEKLAIFQGHTDMLKEMPSRFPMMSGLQCPPHQLYLQLLHLSTSMLVLRQSFEGGDPSDSFARLACETLVLLTKYAQDPTSGLAVIPPVLENAVRMACYAAIVGISSFGQLGLPSYNVFARQMTELAREMSEVWPVFSGSTKLWQKELESRGLMEELDSTGLPKNGGNVDWQNRATVFQRQYSNSMVQGGIKQSREPDLDLEGLDLPMSGLDQPLLNTSIEQQSMPAGLSMPASDPSPSFQGDDVDMIFHNLAYLDTTDWTNNRERGLQEFGFADESTFQDFCNDPERMVNSGGTPFGLLANEANTNFWPPPGFFPGHFGEPDPQVEASQILQSLSNNDPYPTLPEGVGW
jgi:hypothetical protein